MGFGMIGAYGDDDVDAKIKQTALETANEGAERATSAGLIAEPHIVRRGGDISAAILSVAAEVSADAIILGTRGRGGVKSMLLGSVSQAMVHHADRPVLIVPSPEICEQRHQSAAHNAHVTAGAA
jgi:nucleotide-binding universal stress UspA family protein